MLHDGGEAEAGMECRECDQGGNNDHCQALGEIDDPGFITPDFVKACIRVVMCSMRLGDANTAIKHISRS